MSVRNEIFLALLETLKQLKQMDIPTAPVKQVIAFDRVLLAKENYEAPIVVLNGQGPEEILARDITGDRMASEWQISLEVKAENGEDLSAGQNDIVENIKALLDAKPDLGPHCLAIQYGGIQEAMLDNQDERAGARLGVRVIYVQPTGNQAVAAAPAPYGPQFLGDAQTKLIDLVNAFKSDIGVVAVYDHHNVADLRLPAVTIAVEAFQPGQMVGARDRVVDWQVALSIRVHTGYIGGPDDQPNAALILNSIASKFASNWTSKNNKDIELVSSAALREEFAESASTGGSLIAKVNVKVTHTQEA